MSSEASYYIIIPGPVRTDKRLNAEQKFLYGEIAAKCNHRGYCWANNRTLCELMGCTERTLQRNLLELKRAGHLKVDYLHNAGRTDRHIWLVERVNAETIPVVYDAIVAKDDAPHRQKDDETPAKNGPHNTLTDYSNEKKEVSAPSRGAVGNAKEPVKPKEEPPPRPHWQAMVDGWYEF